jgi:tetratricopeptide (TPR) repeat protein
MKLLVFLGADAVGEAERLAQSARSRLAALGGDLEIEAELDYQLAGVLGRTERLHDSIALFERARQGMRLAHGANSPLEGNVLVSLAGAYYKRDNLMSRQGREAAQDADRIWDLHKLPLPSVLIATSPGELVVQVERLALLSRETYGTSKPEELSAQYALMNAYTIAEQDDKALEHARKALELGIQVGDKSVRMPFVRTQIAGFLLDAKQPVEALVHAEHAVAVAMELGFEAELAFSRTMLGRALMENGKLAAARAPLEDALRYMTRTNQPARVRGRTRFLFAMVRYSTEPAKAVSEAVLARAEHEAFDATDEADESKNPTGAAYLRKINNRRIAEIDAWLATTRRVSPSMRIEGRD